MVSLVEWSHSKSVKQKIREREFRSVNWQEALQLKRRITNGRKTRAGCIVKTATLGINFPLIVYNCCFNTNHWLQYSHLPWRNLTLILPRSRTGTVRFYTSTSNKRAARPKLYTKSLTRDLKLMYSRLTLVRISINL